MEIEKLIEQMKWWAEECDRTNFGCQAKKTLQEGICGLSTLQAENERLKNKLSELAHLPFDEPGIGERTRLMAENALLRAELKSKVDLVFQQAKELDRRHLLLQEQEAELEQVKREKDAAVECCRGYCESCAFERDCAKHDMNDAAPTRWYYGDCEDWEWRGTKEG